MNEQFDKILKTIWDLQSNKETTEKEVLTILKEIKKIYDRDGSWYITLIFKSDMVYLLKKIGQNVPSRYDKDNVRTQFLSVLNNI